MPKALSDARRNVTRMQLMSPLEVAAYFESKGLLHDCVAVFDEVVMESGDLVLRMTDVDANFKGLTGYTGDKPCTIIFRNLSDFVTTISLCKVRIYEANVESIAGRARLHFRFSPQGHLSATFGDATIDEGSGA